MLKVNAKRRKKSMVHISAYTYHTYIDTLPKDAECSFLTKRVTFNIVDVLFFSKIA